MTFRVTPLALSLVTVAAWGICVAIVAGRAEPLVAAVPAALVIAALARRRAAPRYALTCAVSAGRIFEGDAVTVTITLTAASPLPLCVVQGAVPAETSLVGGQRRAVLTLEAGATSTVRYDVRCPLRGAYDFGPLIVQVRDRWGVRAWERRHGDRALVRVYPHVVPLRSLPRPLHTQTSIGDYVSPALGEGIEPGDIRRFAPGDRIRQVNWRASLRLGTLYVTQQHRERNADVVLMLDTLAEVGPPHGTTLDLAVRAAASLATAYIARKDRVGLISYGGTIDWVRPGAGRPQYQRLADTLVKASVVFTYLTKDLAFVPSRVLPPHALVIAVTALLDGRFTKAALDLAARGFDLAVLVVSPVAVTRATLPASRTNDLACRLWTLERRGRLDEFRRHGLAVAEWTPGEPLEGALSGLARRRARALAG